MAFTLTRTADLRRQGTNLEPSLVLEIDGISTIFGAGTASAFIRIGDPGLLIDGSWVIGGTREVDDQIDAVSFDGTAATIQQQLLQDKGGTSSVSSIAISLLDVDGFITRLITPGELVDDILGRRAYVFLGFQGTAYPQDYIQIFSGIIDEVTSAGTIILNVAHPDQKKRQQIFPAFQTSLDGAITNSDTTITLVDVAPLLSPADSGTLRTYVRIEDEVIEYGAVNTLTNQITGCIRGSLGTLADSHDDEEDVSTLYRLQGSTIDLALKTLLSGPDDYYLTDIDVESFVVVSPSENVSNAVYFHELDVTVRYGVVAGDFVTTTGATNGANNVTLAEVIQVVVTDSGSYIVLDGVSLVAESPTDATISFRSQYNVLSTGLALGGDQVDVTEFERIDTTFGSSLPSCDFYLTETKDGREFIDKEMLFPAACYSIPRAGRISLGFTSPPLALAEVPVLDSSNVTRPDQLKVKRTINRYLFNTVIYRYNQDIDGEFRTGRIYVDQDSKNRIPVGTKAMQVDAPGLRQNAETSAILEVNSQRVLDRYKNAAETFQVKGFYGDLFHIDVGDSVLFGDAELQIPDTRTATRAFQPRLCEIINKSMNIRSGEVELTLVDTNYSTRGRYGIFSPASILGAGSTTTRLVITLSYGYDGFLEREKWVPYLGQQVLIRNEDWTSTEETTLISLDPSDPNRLIVDTLSGAPPAGYIVEVPYYPPDADPEVAQKYKVLHCFFDPQVEVTTGTSDTVFDVGAGDIGKFFVTSVIRVHNDDYSVYSDEVEVVSIVGTTITVSESLGFTPSTGDLVDLIGFSADLGDAYRYL